MIWIKIAILALCSYLWYLGGQHGGKQARVTGIPLLLGITLGFLSKSWLVGLLTALCMQTFRIGYGNYEDGEKNSILAEITKDRNGWLVRMIYGALVSGIGGAPFLWGHPVKWVIYVVGVSLLGFIVVRLRFGVLLTDLLFGMGIGGVLFLR